MCVATGHHQDVGGWGGTTEGSVQGPWVASGSHASGGYVLKAGARSGFLGFPCRAVSGLAPKEARSAEQGPWTQPRPVSLGSPHTLGPQGHVGCWAGLSALSVPAHGAGSEVPLVIGRPTVAVGSVGSPGGGPRWGGGAEGFGLHASWPQASVCICGLSLCSQIDTGGFHVCNELFTTAQLADAKGPPSGPPQGQPPGTRLGMWGARSWGPSSGGSLC